MPMLDHGALQKGFSIVDCTPTRLHRKAFEYDEQTKQCCVKHEFEVYWGHAMSRALSVAEQWRGGGSRGEMFFVVSPALMNPLEQGLLWTTV